MFAAPWQSIELYGRRARKDDTTWWSFPDDVAEGDTVITVVQAREAAVVDVSVLRMTGEDDWDLSPAEPRMIDVIPIAAIEERTGIAFSVDPRTLHHTEGIAVLEAISAENATPTPWYSLPSSCIRQTFPNATLEGRLWGCIGCDRRWDGETSPRFQHHAEREWPFDESQPVIVCPSCHDILHQPLGPTVDELMFAHRPACPECHEHRTFHLLMGMPAGPPPYGTIAGGCVVTDVNASYRCGACCYEW